MMSFRGLTRRSLLATMGLGALASTRSALLRRPLTLSARSGSSCRLRREEPSTSSRALSPTSSPRPGSSPSSWTTGPARPAISARKPWPAPSPTATHCSFRRRARSPSTNTCSQACVRSRRVCPGYDHRRRTEHPGDKAGACGKPSRAHRAGQIAAGQAYIWLTRQGEYSTPFGGAPEIVVGHRDDACTVQECAGRNEGRHVGPGRTHVRHTGRRTGPDSKRSCLKLSGPAAPHDLHC